MIDSRPLILGVFSLLTIMLNACGGTHGAYNSSSSATDIPTAPINLAGNAGDGAVSLGWEAPTADSGPLSYTVTIAPATASATINYSGTHALIQGLTNNTNYIFSVTAKNNAGTSNATTLPLKPAPVDGDPDSFSPLALNTDPNGLSSIEDPSVLNEASTIWMAYSSINYYQQAGHRVQDASTSLASSNDGGASYTYVTSVSGAPSTAIIAPISINPCRNTSCSGHWVYETPFLVDDKSDPDATRRFKLFALKYFLYPEAATPDQSTFYTLGAIVMWTAPSPASNWSTASVVLSWDATPQELNPVNNIADIDPALSGCTGLTEGSATTFQGALDFVFACPSNGTQDIVMLRSTDHAATFEYIGTPLPATDAAAFGALYFSAPSLLPGESSAPVLMATPVINRPVNISGALTNLDAYSGCVVFPIADEETGSLFRNDGEPLSILQIKNTTSHLNGACAWDRGITGSGILMNDGNASSGTPKFSILKTAKNF